jgi:predicted metal-dependent hydrolase
MRGQQCRHSAQPAPEKRQIVIGGQPVEYVIRHSKRARRLHLEIEPYQGLTVVVPYRYRADGLDRLLLEKGRWILRKLEDIRKPEQLGADGKLARIPYLGEQLTVVWSDSVSSSPCRAENCLLLSKGNSVDMTKIMKEWFRHEATSFIGQRTSEISRRIGAQYNHITIRSQKTLWGSCSAKRNLNFNWRLMMLSPEVIDYVIIHEVCHLKEMNHSAHFWQMVAAYCPQWWKHKAYLKRNSVYLLLPL